MERIIFHIDVNSAFLSWEAVRRVRDGLEDLRLVPSAIGGDREKRTGVILAKSIPAKKYGVKTGEPVAMAIKKCPNLILARPDFSWYEKCSKALNEYKKKKELEVLDIDEIDFEDETLKDIEELKDFKTTLDSYRSFEEVFDVFNKTKDFKK